MSESKIYEIAQMMQDKSIIENDFNEAISMVTKMFQDKYINQMHAAIQERHMACCENPPKEVHLLNALKPFLPAAEHQQMDQIIDMMLFMNTINNIQTEVTPVYTQQTPDTSSYNADDIETAIHEDGIYEIDPKCMLNKQKGSNEILPVFLIMAMHGLFK